MPGRLSLVAHAHAHGTSGPSCRSCETEGTLSFLCVCVVKAPQTRSPGPQCVVSALVTPRGYTVTAQVAPRRRVWE